MYYKLLMTFLHRAINVCSVFDGISTLLSHNLRWICPKVFNSLLKLLYFYFIVVQ